MRLTVTGYGLFATLLPFGTLLFVGLLSGPTVHAVWVAGLLAWAMWLARQGAR